MDIIYTVVGFFSKGGAFMFPILIVAAAAAAIAIERYITLTRAIRKNRSAWGQFEPVITAGDFDKAREVTAKDETIIARVLAVGLARERDVAEELGRDALDRIGAGSDDRHVGAAAPGPLREVADGLDVGPGPGFLRVRRAGLRERGPEPLLPASVGA